MERAEVTRLHTAARRGEALAQMPDAEFTTLPISQKFELIRTLQANIGSIAFWDPVQKRIVVRTDQGLQFLT